MNGPIFLFWIFYWIIFHWISRFIQSMKPTPPHDQFNGWYFTCRQLRLYLFMFSLQKSITLPYLLSNLSSLFFFFFTLTKIQKIDPKSNGCEAQRNALPWSIWNLQRNLQNHQQKQEDLCHGSSLLHPPSKLHSFNLHGDLKWHPKRPPWLWEYITSLLPPYRLLALPSHLIHHIPFCYSILSTVGVSHTVAALYTGREPSLKDTMSVIAKVWKRVLVTFLCVLLVFLVYSIIAGCALFLIVLPLGKVDETTLGVAFVFYSVGLLYLVVVLQLAGVVSVLEESCGFKAIAKSRLLLKEKMALATIIVLTIYSGFGIFLWLEDLVRKMLFSQSSMIMWMNVLGSLLLLLLILVFLLWRLVLETMFYFVCKSYHHESVDMLAISDQDQDLLRSP